jgi:hypothetical protein
MKYQKVANIMLFHYIIQYTSSTRSAINGQKNVLIFYFYFLRKKEAIYIQAIYIHMEKITFVGLVIFENPVTVQ